MAKLTKRDIVVAISNQTGMVQHEVFNVVQRTLEEALEMIQASHAISVVFAATTTGTPGSRC